MRTVPRSENKRGYDRSIPICDDTYQEQTRPRTSSSESDPLEESHPQEISLTICVKVYATARFHETPKSGSLTRFFSDPHRK